MELTQHEVISVALFAGVDPTTVRRFLAGERVWDTTRRRIEVALEKLERLRAGARELPPQTSPPRGGRRPVPARDEEA